MELGTPKAAGLQAERVCKLVVEEYESAFRLGEYAQKVVQHLVQVRVQIELAGKRSARFIVFSSGRRRFFTPCPGKLPSQASIVLIDSIRATNPRWLMAFSAVRAAASTSSRPSPKKMIFPV